MQKHSPHMTRDMTILGGWLFADLLLALVVIFMAAQPAFPKVIPTPTPTPTPTATPPPPVAQLEQHYHRFPVHVDRAAFLKDDPAAVNSVKQQIISQSFLRGRSAGLIIAYGTATSSCAGEGAYTVAQKVYDLVHRLGQTDATFQKTVAYDTLCNIGSDINVITIDIFLFAQQT